MGDNNEDSRTIWCGNLSDKVTDAILYELFLQGGPLERVSIPRDRDGRPRNFGFVTYAHQISIPYALNLFKGTCLFNKPLTMKCRSNNNNQTQQNVRHIENLQHNKLSNGYSMFQRSNLVPTIIPSNGPVSVLPNSLSYEKLLQLGSQMVLAGTNMDSYKGSTTNYNYRNSTHKTQISEATDHENNRDRHNQRHVRHQSDRRSNRNRRSNYNYDRDRRRSNNY